MSLYIYWFVIPSILWSQRHNRTPLQHVYAYIRAAIYTGRRHFFPLLSGQGRWPTNQVRLEKRAIKSIDRAGKKIRLPASSEYEFHRQRMPVQRSLRSITWTSGELIFFRRQFCSRMSSEIHASPFVSFVRLWVRHVSRHEPRNNETQTAWLRVTRVTREGKGTDRGLRGHRFLTSPSVPLPLTKTRSPFSFLFFSFLYFLSLSLSFPVFFLLLLFRFSSISSCKRGESNVSATSAIEFGVFRV